MSNTAQISQEFPIKSVLVVDDEESLRLVLIRVLEMAGFVCTAAKNAEQALKLLESGSFDLVVSDIVMPGMDGIELLNRIKAVSPDLDVVLMTGYGSEYSYGDIMNAGASDYLTKPFKQESVLARIHRIAREKNNLINLKKTNQELCAAIERANRLAMEAKEASKAKTFFLASMSHEIRTPLNGIVGYTEMLMDTRLDEEQQLFLKNALFSCDALLSVVNDILDFSKVEAGRLAFESIGFDPEILCFEAIDMVRPRVDESCVELMVSVADNVPGVVNGDPHRFRQVLLNLLSNAAKFTSKGRIRLEIDSEEIDKTHCRILVRVRDTGIGIAPDAMEKIFDPFIQSENATASKYGGTGLGLAISRNIARKMGGDIQVESIENKGSVFAFTACLKIAGNGMATRVRSARLKGRNIVICTVSDENTGVLSHELSLCDVVVSSVELDRLEHNLKELPERSFDAGILDFGNHDMALIKKALKGSLNAIQNAGFDFIACAIPVPGMAEMFRQAGIKGFLPKPVSRSKLLEMVGYVIGVREAGAGFSESETQMVTTHFLNESKKHTASILLVEDNRLNQKMTKMMLSKAGYMVNVAPGGQAAVQKYTEDPDAYDLIFMDINMPGMDGFQAAELIRAHEKANPAAGRVPILALTANVLDDFKDRCEKAQMDDFLTKPIKREVVLKAVLKWTGVQ